MVRCPHSRSKAILPYSALLEVALRLSTTMLLPTWATISCEYCHASCHSGRGTDIIQSSVDAAVEFGGVRFNLGQTLTLCPGLMYTANFFTISQCPSVGACICSLQACVGSNCINFDPAGGDVPTQQFSFNFIAASAQTTLTVQTNFCERRFVRFDDFSVKPVGQ